MLQRIARKMEKMYHRYIGYYPGKIGGDKFKLNNEDRRFWKDVSENIWEPETFNVLSRYLNPESTYLDIGAWIGPTVLYAAKKSKKVICFEPDPVAFDRLKTNLTANRIDNVIPYHVALSDSSFVQSMYSRGDSLGDSRTSLLAKPKENSPSFEALVLDWKLVENMLPLDEINLVKIDIEGGEFALIPRMEDYLMKHGPVLWLSLHAPFLPENERKTVVQSIVDSLSKSYTTCLDENLNQIAFEDLLDEDSINNCRAFLFLNEK